MTHGSSRDVDVRGGRARSGASGTAGVSRTLHATTRRLSWGLADQAVSSLTNFAVGICVAREFDIQQPATRSRNLARPRRDEVPVTAPPRLNIGLPSTTDSS